MTNRQKIITLWTVFLFGMVFHSLLAMMPLFFGASIAMQDAMGECPPSMMWMSLLIYLLPMILIVLILSTEEKWYKITNFTFSILFTLMNIFHIVGHLSETPVKSVQVVLLTFVLISGILLNIVSYKWMKEEA